MHQASKAVLSGEVKPEMKILLWVSMSEIKSVLHWKSLIFCFFYALKLQNYSLYRDTTAFLTVFFFIKLDASSVFTGNYIGCKLSLQLKNSLKLHSNEQISRTLRRKNAYRRLRQSSVTCVHNVKFALLVMSFKS